MEVRMLLFGLKVGSLCGWSDVKMQDTITLRVQNSAAAGLRTVTDKVEN
jgi:hypothetical protein